jgi:serine/threonine-protein kinase
MTLDAGTRFGPYEIVEPIGAGGMGEVYRATDTKLGRDVAIKTLPAAFAGDQERLARFEREAKLLAVLNHPHIATIHALGDHNGTHYVAMELVSGQTLEEKLKSGAIPVEDALRLALQLAEALEAAHGKGVIHRDLKPANVMLTRDGQVKVLDFGLAKAFSGKVEEASPLHSPALSAAMTQKGLVLGTAGYMAPEQASGQTTDQRADVWAFGVVLYEMLTGLPLFSGESVPHILAEVLKTEPNWMRLPRNLHPRIRQLLERCLTKKPRLRLHSIADARIEIEAVLSDPRGVMPGPTVEATGTRASSALRFAGALAIAVAAAAAGWWLRPTPTSEAEPELAIQAALPLPEGQSFQRANYPLIASSSDGRRIAYVANGQIFLRDLTERDARPVRGTDEGGLGPAAPTFSPDGEWLAYVHVAGPGGPFTVKRVPASGGAPVSLHGGSGVRYFPQGLTWPTQDAMLFANADGIVRIPSTGERGAAGSATLNESLEILVPRGEGERFYSPQLLPSGSALLFTRVAGEPGTKGGLDTAQVVMQSIGANDRRVLWDGGSAPRYVPTGHLLYAQGTSLFAVAFDPAERAVRGRSVEVLEGLSRVSSRNTDAANYAVSDTGTLIVIRGDPDAVVQDDIESTIIWVDREGGEEPFPVRRDDYTTVRISPDATKVAFVIGSNLFTGAAPAIWVFDRETEILSLLTADAAGDDGPLWSSDSSHIFFRSFRDDVRGVYSIDVDTREVTLVGAATPTDFRLAMPWTTVPNGSLLGLVDPITLTDFNIATLDPANGEFTRILDTEGRVTEPSFAPNGAWLAYADEPDIDSSEITIVPFPDVARTRIPVGAGSAPVFSHDGSELFFRDATGISVVPVTYAPTLRIGTSTRLFGTATYLWSRDGRAWDPEPNGERFLVIRMSDSALASDAALPGEIDIVLNWFEELERLVPTQ